VTELFSFLDTSYSWAYRECNSKLQLLPISFKLAFTSGECSMVP